MATIDKTQDASSPALTSKNGYEMLVAYFEFSKGSAPATGDIFQIWDIEPGTRIHYVSAQAPDLADGDWSVGDGTDADRYLSVADASAAVTTIDATEGLGVKYTSADTLDVTMGTLTTATDVTFKVTVFYTLEYNG